MLLFQELIAKERKRERRKIENNSSDKQKKKKNYWNEFISSNTNNFLIIGTIFYRIFLFLSLVRKFLSTSSKACI